MSDSVGIFCTGFALAVLSAVMIGKCTETAEKRQHMWHPPTSARVTFKEQHNHKEGPPTLVLGFVAWGGYFGSVRVDSSAFERVSHWQCIRVRFNEDYARMYTAWTFMGLANDCENIR